MIKINGTGSWTYTFLPGTDLLTLSGYYQLDEIPSITVRASLSGFKGFSRPSPKQCYAHENLPTTIVADVNCLGAHALKVNSVRKSARMSSDVH